MLPKPSATSMLEAKCVPYDDVSRINLKQLIKTSYSDQAIKDYLRIYDEKLIYRKGTSIFVGPGVMDNLDGETSGAMHVYLMANYFGPGPKYFELKPLQFEAMIHTKANFPVCDYEQPFPCVMIEFPKLTDGTWYKDYIGGIVLKDDIGVCFVLFRAEGKDVGGMFRIREDQTFLMEDGLQEVRQSFGGDLGDSVFHGAKILFNTMQLAVMLGYDSKGNPKAKELEKARNAKKISRVAMDRVEFEYKSTPICLSFQQHIVLHDETCDSAAHTLGGTGFAKKPHWREGHFAMQPYGEGLSLRKRIFRKPVFVNRDYFLGKLSNTSVTMEIKNGCSVDRGKSPQQV